MQCPAVDAVLSCAIGHVAAGVGGGRAAQAVMHRYGMSCRAWRVRRGCWPAAGAPEQVLPYRYSGWCTAPRRTARYIRGRGADDDAACSCTMMQCCTYCSRWRHKCATPPKRQPGQERVDGRVAGATRGPVDVHKIAVALLLWRSLPVMYGTTTDTVDCICYMMVQGQ